MNNVQILGTITREPELKYTQSGTAILSFGIAYNEKYKKQDGSFEDKAHFFDVTAFGKRGETINQYFSKGARILIGGSLDFQSWNDQQGQKRSKVSIKLNDFDFIDKKTDKQQSNNSQANYQQPQQQAPQQYQAPQPQYQNQQGQQVTQQQYNQNQQQAQVPPAIDVDEDEIPF